MPMTLLSQLLKILLCLKRVWSMRQEWPIQCGHIPYTQLACEHGSLTILEWGNSEQPLSQHGPQLWLLKSVRPESMTTMILIVPLPLAGLLTLVQILMGDLWLPPYWDVPNGDLCLAENVAVGINNVHSDIPDLFLVLLFCHQAVGRVKRLIHG